MRPVVIIIGKLDSAMPPPNSMSPAEACGCLFLSLSLPLSIYVPMSVYVTLSFYSPLSVL